MEVEPHSNSRMRFGTFEVNLDERDLRRDGAKIKLNEKPFQVLAVLLERAGRIVRRDEIRSRLWPADTYVDFDANLNTALSTLRHALGDSADSPSFIETVPRQGYRFIATVVAIADPETSAPITLVHANDQTAATVEAAPFFPPAGEPTGIPLELVSVPPRLRASGAYVTAIACILVAAAALFGFIYLRRGRTNAAGLSSQAKLFVAPFENLSGDATQDYLSDGVTEELTTQLGARSPEYISVVARATAAQYKQHRAPVQEIAREQKVEYVVNGSLQRQDDQVHLTAQLFQSSDGKILWAESYDRGSKDLFDIEHDVAANIARVLAANAVAKASSYASTSTAPSHEVNPDAYDHYLRGLYALNSRASADRTARSTKEFNRAIELDQQFAAPYVGLAQTYITAAQWLEMDPKQGYALAKEYAQKAIALNDGLTDAHLVLGMELYESEWDWAGAETEFQRALASSPNSAHAVRKYASYLMSTLRFDEAAVQFERAEKIDPNPAATSSNLCMLQTLSRRYDLAISECHRALDAVPENSIAKYYLAASYLYTNHFSDALAVAKKGGGNDAMFRSEIGIIYARMGDKQAAEKILAELQASRDPNAASPYGLAEIYSELGDKQAALKMLRHAFDVRSPDLLFMSKDPDFDNLRDADAYKQIVAQIGLPATQPAEINVAQVQHLADGSQK
jgi:TolB-like protein/DNA-binding winged helix-turn-helix (wHTH) protein/Tfp pilus assembly protein PilF